MKNSVKIIAVFLLLFISGRGALNAQKNAMDTTRMNRPWRHHLEMSDMRHMRGMGHMDHFGPGHFGGDRLRIESISNLTDTQKKEIADLRQKHLNEMKKFRDEMTAKIKDMRESHRKDILNLLTDEQKKFLESGSENTNMGSSKQK